METPQTVAVVNSHVRCPLCQRAGKWVAIARPDRRQNSTVYQLRCQACGNRVAAKVSGGKQYRADHCAELKNEYTTLCHLHGAYTRHEDMGVLKPLGFIEAAGHGILVTQWFAGSDLARAARQLDAAALARAFRLAGEWLLQLHDADDEPRPCVDLGVTQKIDHLSKTYGDVLRCSARAQKALELLATSGIKLATWKTRAVRIHGDFKPQNMLYDHSSCVGLDIHWGIIGAATYDLAPFLNHLWMAIGGNHGAAALRRYQVAEEAFLRGYGATGLLEGLRWVQLYFALCQLGSYRQRGRLSVVYANWQIMPLVRRLENQLRESS
ncbi:phosphotransferase family protein [Rhodanobacter caeni]|uniref:Aminoglycoside phosphotransferase domain-containing protein n=1 Tax=Rhodanobacter caeni TaxID=657654 RepID=A0ABN0UJS7_9GAMM